MKNLCRAIIWSACFLESADDDTLDPDSAVKALEDIATCLQSASHEEQKAFIAACNEEADSLQNDALPTYRAAADYIRKLPYAVGIVED